MNLIDFHVTEIIKEEYGKVYELLNMKREEVDTEEELWQETLLSDGVKQKYRYLDDGGEFIGEDIFVSPRKPYYVGYVGQH